MDPLSPDDIALLHRISMIPLELAEADIANHSAIADVERLVDAGYLEASPVALRRGGSGWRYARTEKPVPGR